MYAAKILPEAVDDIAKAARWYARRQKGLGKRFSRAVRARVQELRQFPKSSPVRYGDTRTAVVRGFPFMVHYLVDDGTKEVVVAAVFHTSTDPERWDDR